ncbi:MAG: hypothetical protein V3U45_03025 [bacterium]
MKTQSGLERKYLQNGSTETIEFDEVRCLDCQEGEATEVAKAYSESLVKQAEEEGVTLPPPAPVLTCDNCGHEAARYRRVVPPGGITDVPKAMVAKLTPYGFTVIKAADVKADAPSDHVVVEV